MPESTASNSTKRIHITLPETHIKALDILAGDPKDKSKAVERIINEYVEFREEYLKKRGIYKRLISVLKGDLEQKIAVVDEFIENYPEMIDKKYLALWNLAKINDNIDDIELVYNYVEKKISSIREQLKEELNRN